MQMQEGAADLLVRQILPDWGKSAMYMVECVFWDYGIPSCLFCFLTYSDYSTRQVSTHYWQAHWPDGACHYYKNILKETSGNFNRTLVVMNVAKDTYDCPQPRSLQKTVTLLVRWHRHSQSHNLSQVITY